MVLYVMVHFCLFVHTRTAKFTADILAWESYSKVLQPESSRRSPLWCDGTRTQDQEYPVIYQGFTVDIFTVESLSWCKMEQRGLQRVHGVGPRPGIRTSLYRSPSRASCVCVWDFFPIYQMGERVFQNVPHGGMKSTYPPLERFPHGMGCRNVLGAEIM